jgi:hypothetical protein
VNNIELKAKKKPKQAKTIPKKVRQTGNIAYL